MTNDGIEGIQDSPRRYNVSVVVAVLCVCMLTHSYLLISVFPYAGFLAIELVESVNEDNAGRYAGFIASSFMLGRALTSVLWGKVADVYGRKAVLMASLILSSIFSLLFGVASTFGAVLVVRFSLGLSNGLLLSVKTMVSELGSDDDEARLMSIVICMWGFGFLISPAVSGMLAEPLQQYPNMEWDKGTETVLRRHPFLLPNILGSALCICAAILVKIAVPETLESCRPPSYVLGDVVDWFRRACRQRGPSYRVVTQQKDQSSDVSEEQDESDTSAEEGEDCSNNNDSTDEIATFSSLWKRHHMRRLLIVYWSYSFLSLTVDETFPLFCMSSEAGFGITEKDIGKILSLCGFVFVIFQYPVNSLTNNWFGLLGAVRTGSALAVPSMILLPLSLLLNLGTGDGVLRTRTSVFLGCVMAFYRVFSFVFFTSISVLLNRSVASSQRATMNGLSNLGGSAAKGLGPVFAGLLVSESVHYFGSAGALVMFSTIGGLGIVLSCAVFLYLEEVTDYEGGVSCTLTRSATETELTRFSKDERADDKNNLC